MRKHALKYMKVSFCFLLAILFSISTLFAQTDRKERKEAKRQKKELRKQEKELRKEIKDRPHRKVRKQARKYRKEGWFAAPGSIPIEKQLEKGYMYQYQEDAKGHPVYLVATGNSVAESQAAAKLQATELAKLELAGQVHSRITALIENNIATNQLSNEDAASVTKTVAASKNIIIQEIDRVLVFIEMYKKIGTNVEAAVKVGYNSELAMQAAKRNVRKQLEEETDLLQDKLDELMDF